MPNQYTRRPVAERFWPKVNKDGPIPEHCPKLGPCWLWTGARMPDGRGQFHYEGRTEYAATVAYILTYGPLPADRPWVLHKCDGGRLPCVRPDHLFAGTHEQNMADMVSKGRHSGGAWTKTKPERLARGDRHGSRTHPERVLRGSDRPDAKLTEAIVLEARTRYARGGVTVEALALWAGVATMTMHSAISRRSWKHVP
jgi:hypothetical protein